MNKKPPRRSIVSSFSAFAGPASAEPAAPAAGEAAPEQKADFSLRQALRPAAARVGAGIIGATQRTLTDIREGARRLLAQVEAGGLVEVASGDGGSVTRADGPAATPLRPSRLPDDDPSAFEALKRSLAEEGQKVPVELRGIHRLPAATSSSMATGAGAPRGS